MEPFGDERNWFIFEGLFVGLFLWNNFLDRGIILHTLLLYFSLNRSLFFIFLLKRINHKINLNHFIFTYILTSDIFFPLPQIKSFIIVPSSSYCPSNTIIPLISSFSGKILIKLIASYFCGYFLPPRHTIY